MKISLIKIIFLTIMTAALIFAADGTKKFKVSSATKTKVAELLSKMTLEEKVGQMTQVTIQVVSKTEGTVKTDHQIDDDKLKEAILNYKVGSLLNVFNKAHDLNYWREIITKIQNIAVNESRLGIPVLYGIDAIHGATYTTNSTLFPQSINMAASFNKDMAEKIGMITSFETKASGIPWNFYPVMDIGRQPLWSRLWETFGEDVCLSSAIGSAYIKGAQGDNIAAEDKLATCLKHYVGYSYPNNGKDRTPAWISERMMREYFLPPFQAALDAGAPTVMVNSGEVDGIPTHSDYHLLTEVLKGEFQFEGFIVSDWEDIKRLHDRDRIAATPKEAVKIAVMAGVDMSMVPTDYSFYNYLLELVKDGEVPIERIDEAVTRILSVKMEVGLFENPVPGESLVKNFANAEFTKTNLDAARESIILTKNNDSVLPLSKGKKIFVAGPTANKLSVLNGGWTITWQGNEESLYPKDENTILEALQNKFGKDNIVFEDGVDFEKPVSDNVDKANGCDVIILCLGEPAYCESPGSINDMTLPAAQLEYAEKLAGLGKPIVLVMIGGRPRLINRIEPKVDAVLVGFLPGMKGGDAVADIISGDVNPSGKLPVSYPKFVNGFSTYDFKNVEVHDVNKVEHQWSFGHGLSYTTFEYSDLNLSSKNMNVDGSLTVTVKVKNTGSVEGKEVVQLYLRDLYGSVSRPNKQLKAFEKINLKPAEEKVISFTVTPEMLSFIGRDHRRIIEAGDFEIIINNLKEGFKLENSKI